MNNEYLKKSAQTRSAKVSELFSSLKDSYSEYRRHTDWISEQINAASDKMKADRQSGVVPEQEYFEFVNSKNIILEEMAEMLPFVPKLNIEFFETELKGFNDKSQLNPV